MARGLRCTPEEVVGRLCRVWAWARQETTDGEIPLATEADVDRAAGKKRFGKAMESVGWIEFGDEVGVALPKWKLLNGLGAKSRLDNAFRQREFRKRNANRNASRNAKRNADRNATAHTTGQDNSTGLGGPPPLARGGGDPPWKLADGDGLSFAAHRASDPVSSDDSARLAEDSA